MVERTGRKSDRPRRLLVLNGPGRCATSSRRGAGSCATSPPPGPRERASRSFSSPACARRIRLLEAQIRAVDDAIADTIAADPELSAQAAILRGIPGFGAVSAAALLAEMPELGRLEPKAAASLAGLAPIDRASGQSARRARIRGGRWGARRARFMRALAAARHNPDLAAHYRALRAAGKPPKLALVAVMRKLLLLANALLRDNRPGTPARP